MLGTEALNISSAIEKWTESLSAITMLSSDPRHTGFLERSQMLSLLLSGQAIQIALLATLALAIDARILTSPAISFPPTAGDESGPSMNNLK